jgi:phage-related protein
VAGNIKGITIDIGGNVTPLNKALESVNKTSNNLNSELREVNKLLKLDPTNTELLAQKQKLLGSSVENSTSKLKQLKDAEKDVQEQFQKGKISEEQYRAFQREIAKTEGEIKKLGDQTEKTQKKTKDFGDGFDKVGNAVKAGAVAIGAGVVALGAMAEKAIENADELQRLSDVTDMSAETLQEFKYIGANLGVELETITGAQTKLIKSMAAAQGGSKAQGEAFKELGVKVTNSKGQLLDSQEVMGDVFEALSKIENPTKRDALAMQILGKSARDLNPLILAGSDGLNKLTEDARTNGAIMSNEAVAGLDAFGDNLDNLKNSVMGAFGESLAQLLPMIQDMISKIDLEKVKQGIKEFSEKTIEVFKFIMDNGETIKALLVGIGTGLLVFNVATMINGVVGAIKAFQLANEGATVAQWALNAAQSANPIGIIVALIAGLVVTLIALWNTNEGFRNAVIGTWNAIKESAISVWSTITKFFTVDIPNAFNGIMLFFQGLWNWVVAFFQQWGTIILAVVLPFIGIPILIMQNWGAIQQWFSNLLSNIISFFSELPYKIGLAIGTTLATLVEWYNGLINWIITDVPKIIENIVKFFIELPGKIWTFLSDVWNKWVEFRNGLYEKAIETGTSVVGAVIQFFSELPGKIWTAIIGVKDKIVAWGTSLISTAQTEIPKFITTVVDFFLELPGKIFNIGVDLVKGLWNGIQSMVGWIGDKVKSFIQGIKDGFTGKDALDTHSPSRWAEMIGKFVAEGFGIGISNGKGGVFEKVADVVNGIKSTFNELVGYINLATEKAKLEFQLWGVTDGKSSSEQEKTEKQLQTLNSEYENQSAVVETTAEALRKVISTYGENSKESKELENQLIKEKIAYAELGIEIDKVNKIKAGQALEKATSNQNRYLEGLSLANKYMPSMTIAERNAYAGQYANANGGSFQYEKPTTNNSATVVQNFYTETASPFAVKKATEKALNNMVLGAI